VRKTRTNKEQKKINRRLKGMRDHARSLMEKYDSRSRGKRKASAGRNIRYIDIMMEVNSGYRQG